MTLSTQVSAIIVAAGKGERMGSSTNLPKQFLPVGGIPILAHTLRTFEASDIVDEIVLVTRPEFRSQCEALIREFNIQKIRAVIDGGKERSDSVRHGLQALDPQTEIVIIHDAVRMFVSHAEIADSVKEARRHGSSVVAVPAKDTIKQVILQPEADGDLSPDSPRGLFVEKTYERSVLWQIQTPQTFQFTLIRRLHEQAAAQQLRVTDDAMLAEHFGHPVKIVPGSYRNIKITTPDDLLIAEAFRQDEREG